MGWNLYLNEVLNKTGIVTLTLVIGMHITRQNRPKSHFWGVSPVFGRESPWNDITISQKRHNLTQKKSENEMCERFYLIIYARRSSHLENLNMWAHFEFLNSNISLMNGRQVLIFQLGPDISIIWRWYERGGWAISHFQDKIGPTYCKNMWQPHHPPIFSWKWLIAQAPHSYHHQITLISGPS